MTTVGPAGERNPDHAAHGPPPVPRLREGPVHAWRGDLERVGRLGHDPCDVKLRRQRLADQGHIVEADPARRVHHDPQQPSVCLPG